MTKTLIDELHDLEADAQAIGGIEARKAAGNFTKDDSIFLQAAREAAYRKRERILARYAQTPIDMVLYCPACGKQHIDAPEPSMMAQDAAMFGGDWPSRWTNPPHRSHLCHDCGYVWRPADVPTNGVAAVKTRGKNDSPAVEPQIGSWVSKEDYMRNVKVLDVALNGDRAAERPLLIDILSQVEAEVRKRGAPLLAKRGTE